MNGLDAALADWRGAAVRVAMVPTMGALHEGHLALVAKAREVADKVVASIFVNPLQFNDKSDLDRYPRQVERDAAMLEEAGCDLLWMPSAADFYPDGFATTVHVDGVTGRWEGEHRPGHFDGVTTVVCKLLTGIRPDIAIFGEKDFQQLAVIRRMNGDLGLGAEIIGHPTVRAEDGLALSSRNALLDERERAAAVVLPDALKAAAKQIGAGGDPRDAVARAKERLTSFGFGPVDYVAYVDPDTLEPLPEAREGGRLIAAAYLGKVRLIDNMRVDMDTV